MRLVDLFAIASDARSEGRLADAVEVLAQAGDASKWYEVLVQPSRQLLLHGSCVRSFDPRQVTLTFNGVTVRGFAEEVLNGLLPDTASGAQLDNIAELIGVPRSSR
jgi:hypothetical protein